MFSRFLSKYVLAAMAGTVLMAAAIACSSPVPEVEDHTGHDMGAAVVSVEHDHGTDAARVANGAGGHDHDGVGLSSLPGSEYPPVVINVSFDSTGPSPALVSVPAGRQVQLVFRNRDTVEHHYHILGLETVGMRWLSKEGTTLSAEEAAEIHEAHHPGVQMVDYHICTSRSGICPTGEWIHAHAEPGEMDIIIFVTETAGRYKVTDPLNPQHSAEVIVF